MLRALEYLTFSETAGLRLVSTSFSELVWKQLAMVFEYWRCWGFLQNAPRILELFWPKRAPPTIAFTPDYLQTRYHLPIPRLPLVTFGPFTLAISARSETP